MSISAKELQKKESNTKLILEAKNIQFDDWLAEKYDEVFEENGDTIQKALKYLAAKEKIQKLLWTLNKWKGENKWDS